MCLVFQASKRWRFDGHCELTLLEFFLVVETRKEKPEFLGVFVSKLAVTFFLCFELSFWFIVVRNDCLSSRAND